MLRHRKRRAILSNVRYQCYNSQKYGVWAEKGDGRGAGRLPTVPALPLSASYHLFLEFGHIYKGTLDSADSQPNQPANDGIQTSADGTTATHSNAVVSPKITPLSAGMEKDTACKDAVEGIFFPALCMFLISMPLWAVPVRLCEIFICQTIF